MASLIDAGGEGKEQLEQHLIKKAANGDLEAFISLVEQYKGFLMAVILPILRDHHLSEDMLQESLVQIFRSLPGYRGGNFKSWLARIAVNKALDWKRKEKRRCRESPLTEAESYPAGQIRGSTVEEKVIGSDNIERFRMLVMDLPSLYRRTLVGYYLEELNYVQLAAREGITVKSVESRLYRARKALKDKWKEDQPWSITDG